MQRRLSPHTPFRNRVCAVVATPAARVAMADLRKALRYTSTVELRLDWLRSDRERDAFLKLLGRMPKKGANLIATCRRILGGGKLAGGAEAELHWLAQARQAGCDWCDLEIETLRELPGNSARPFPIPSKILLSFHDFQKTPRFPKKHLRVGASEADAIKIATLAQSIPDSVRLLRLARASRNVVVAPMGQAGLPARLLALRDGSALAYAPVAAATAPGQVSLDEFKSLYRADRISRKTEIYGVVGNPIGHSLSPLLHNTGFIAAKRDATYVPFLVDRLKDFIDAIPAFGLRGCSVTIPHKQGILRYLAECEFMAEEIGAVNTVVVDKSGRLRGFNTDYTGVVRALHGRIRPHRTRALIFGAGGSARAAAFALVNEGAEVLICARRESAAKELARASGAQAIARKHLQWAKFELIVNATPVGMYPEDRASPLLSKELNCEMVMDLIYRPLQTRLLRLAKARGIATISGVDMFLAQGYAQWELWTGKPAPEAAMRRAVMRSLRLGEKR